LFNLCRHAKEIVGSESFMDLRESNLRLILSSDYLIGVSEVNLFEACLKLVTNVTIIFIAQIFTWRIEQVLSFLI